MRSVRPKSKEGRSFLGEAIAIWKDGKKYTQD
jgi:hypothetical protein